MMLLSSMVIYLTSLDLGWSSVLGWWMGRWPGLTKYEILAPWGMVVVL